MKYAVVVAALLAGLSIWALLGRRLAPALAGPATLPSGGSDPMDYQKASFAAGCFWGVEAAFRHVPGVISTEVGFSGGHLENPTYRQVCTDTTGHAETVLVTFDPALVSYPELLDAFWTSHDPTQLNRQGPDFGTQYRSVIFYHSKEQELQAEASLKELQDGHVFDRKIVTEIVEATPFYKAEDYHQQYFEKQGLGPEACHVGPVKVHTKLAAAAAEARQKLAADRKAAAATRPTTSPTTAPSAASCNPADANSACGTSHWKQLTDDELKARLTPEQYRIARKAGTEQAFTGKYWDDHRQGIYHCAVCGQSLFDSSTKFDSGTGWPSFWQPIVSGAVTDKSDNAYGMRRTEVLCSQCGSHLGHVFDDGPKPSGLRYCMNSEVLDLHVGEKP